MQLSYYTTQIGNKLVMTRT